MPRAAGDGKYYDLSILNIAGKPVGVPVHLVSVTTVLDALPKFLQWWGYKLGLTAGQELLATGEPLVGQDVDKLYEKAKTLGRQLKVTTPSNVLKKAGQRGTDIHDIAESWFKEGRIPSPDEVPVEHHGYVKALARWIDQLPPHEVIYTELPVFSLRHRYAGTLDLLVKFKDEIGSYAIIDFKTSKDIYESALIQMAAYREAVYEMGLVPYSATCEATAVNLQANGEYKERDSNCTVEDFLRVKEVWEMLNRLKEEADAVAAAGV